MPIWNPDGFGWIFSKAERKRQQELRNQLIALAMKEDFSVVPGKSFGNPSTFFICPPYRKNLGPNVPAFVIVHHESGDLGLLLVRYKLAEKRFETVRFAVAHRLAFANQHDMPGFNVEESA